MTDTGRQSYFWLIGEGAKFKLKHHAIKRANKIQAAGEERVSVYARYDDQDREVVWMQGVDRSPLRTEKPTYFELGVVCDSGEFESKADAIERAEQLIDLGWPSVFVLDGDMVTIWKDGEQALNQEHHPFEDTSKSFQSRIQDVPDPGQDSPAQFEVSIEHIDQLSWGEKWAILLGLLALHGDGEFSQEEIEVLRRLVGALPESTMESVIHRDPTDEALSLDEKVAWVVDVIKSGFGKPAGLNDKDIERIFRLFVKSIDRDIENTTSKSGKRVELATGVVNTLEALASADGKVSKREQALIRAYKSTSKYIVPVWQVLIALACIGLAIYGVYRLFVWLF